MDGRDMAVSALMLFCLLDRGTGQHLIVIQG